MSADLTCPTCNEPIIGCLRCHERHRQRSAEWDALKAEGDEWKRKAEAWHDKAWRLMNEAQSLRSAARDVLLFRDRLPDWVHVGIDAALDSDPDLAERTRRIRADE